MTGKRYYMTTLGDWQRHAARFANSHFIVLDAPEDDHRVECGSEAPAPSSPGLATAALLVASACSTPGQARAANSGGKPPHSAEAHFSITFSAPSRIPRR